MWVWYYLFPCMPLQVWAAPPSLREDLGANGRHDDSLPEHLGSTASLGAQTTLQDELHFSMLQQSMHHDLTRPLENADALPVLQEPKGRTPDENRGLRRLRSVTRRFGGRWITDPPLRLPGLLPPQSEDESDSDSTAAAQVLRVPCAILRPGYTAETFDVIIQIPATPGELSEVLQTLRHPEIVADFPQLVPTLPQPRVGVATFVAYPDWPITDVLICLDPTAIDGRLFAA
eukprot:s12152_g1.t1